MQSAQDLLDSCGWPPAAVCIDWAYQLVSMAKAGRLPEQFTWIDLQVSKSGQLDLQAGNQFDDPAVTDSSDGNADDAEQGLTYSSRQAVLSSASEAVQNSSFQYCVMQLVKWSGAEQAIWNASSLFCSLEHVQSVLRDLAKQYSSGLDWTTEDLQRSSLSSSVPLSHSLPLDENASAQASTITPTSENSVASSDERSTIPKLEPATSKPSQQAIERTGPRLLVYAGVSAAILMLSLFGWWLLDSKDNPTALATASDGTRDGTSPSTSPRTGDSSGTKSSSPAKNFTRSSGSRSTERSGRSSASTSSNSSELDQLLGGSVQSRLDLSEQNGGLSRSAADALPESEAVQIQSLNQPLTTTAGTASEQNPLDLMSKSDGPLGSNLLGNGSTLLAHGSTPTKLATETSQGQMASQASAADADTIEPSAATEGAPSISQGEAQRLNLDVASETSQDSVAKMLASFASSDAKTGSKNSSADSASPSTAAFLLNVEDLVQVQQIPNKIRVREPAWELRLLSTSMMEIEPTGVQTLAEKIPARWVITARELKPRKGQEPTKVTVSAEIANHRGDIRWKIVAGTQDLPNLWFPMNQEKLDALLDMLQNYQQRLNVSIDQIKAAMELPDFPKELKSYWTAQRRNFENEVKLTTRARLVAADASMLTSWMDRTLEVHGRLLDTAGASGKNQVLLEFGKPQQTPSTEAPTKDSNTSKDDDKS